MTKQPSLSAASREARLAAKLRENLRRRKEQSREQAKDELPKDGLAKDGLAKDWPTG